ncbi:mersacidin family lantibiotic [Priestia megaterium]|uniref:mersacidin family lantibiotic n=1 Tax=Priestia megaterium TaxID=1404 RepID=UPI00070208AD|nr:mersacidin family lantibiotic [Priestia megaterium]KQU17824.1 type 2 lantibiotic [Bacillus sp. Leaf75]MDQ0808091.1 NOL1/NOP2/fmu family ribosome biogenesis protein [Priestia megaterium]
MSRNQVMEELKMNHPAGAPMVEVSEDELNRIYGGGDVRAETTISCGAVLVTIGIYISKQKGCV